MIAPWSAAVWIQSIHGRRLWASTGPVAPRITTGMRSHQALKIAMVAWKSPTLECTAAAIALPVDRKSTRLNSSHVRISYAVFCLKKKKKKRQNKRRQLIEKKEKNDR